MLPYTNGAVLTLWRRDQRAIFLAAAASLGAHAVSGLALGWWSDGRRGRAPALAEPATWLLAVASDTRQEIDLIAAAEALPEDAAPSPMPDPPAVADWTRAGADEPARLGIGARDERLAADRGAGAGRPLPPGHRRDDSTLRARLTDGADVYKPARLRTAVTAASPQAERRDPIVGVGDAPRARHRESHAVPTVAEAAAAEDRPRAVPGVVADEQETRAGGAGPLDAEAGPRRFDVATAGAARDDRASRSASNEARPGPFDLAAAAAPGAGEAGKGSGAAPGRTTAPSAGQAAERAGADRGALAGDPRAATAAREPSPYERDIGRRVAEVARFPRRLALMMVQGETIVRFALGADGRVTGSVEIVKSSGYAEFDHEAVGAVGRAAPFPASGRAMVVSLRVPFENPMMR